MNMLLQYCWLVFGFPVAWSMFGGKGLEAVEDMAQEWTNNRNGYIPSKHLQPRRLA
jgi:hypothetical protein